MKFQSFYDCPSQCMIKTSKTMSRIYTQGLLSFTYLKNDGPQVQKVVIQRNPELGSLLQLGNLAKIRLHLAIGAVSSPSCWQMFLDSRKDIHAPINQKIKVSSSSPCTVVHKCNGNLAFYNSFSQFRPVYCLVIGRN